MRGLPFILVSIVTTLLLAQAVSGMQISVTQTPALYVSDFGEGISHTINSYSLQPNRDIAEGEWMLLGTNDQATFARIDARRDNTFLAGGIEEFNVPNSAPYRYYYLYVQDGFPAGTNLEFHLNELSPPPSPTPSQVKDVSIVINRVPLVVIADFGGKSMKLQDYTFTSSETLPAVQSWQLYGTNDPAMLGSNDLGDFTLLDDRSGIAFENGVARQFDLDPASAYQYYVFYLEDGFAVKGMTLEIQFHESMGEPTPTPTPTPSPTPTVTPTPTPSTPSLPVVDYEGSPRAGYQPLQVSFTDRTLGTVSSRLWDFGDGSTSSEQNPVHTYSTAGLFSVNLTACTDGGCSFLNRTYIYVVPPADATPTGTPRVYIQIGGGSGGSSQGGSGSGKGSGSGQGTSGSGQGGAGQGTDGNGDSGGQGSSQSGGTGGSQGTGGWSGQGKTSGSGTSNPAQSQQNPAADVPSWIQALRDIGGMVGGVLQTAIDQLLHLLGR